MKHTFHSATNFNIYMYVTLMMMSFGIVEEPDTYARKGDSPKWCK